MDAEILATLLGKRSTDPQIEAALQHLGVTRRPELEIDPYDADGPVVASQDWVSNLSAGIEFGFQEEGAFLGLGRAERSAGPMILTEVYFYAERSGARPYRRPLPFGLSLDDTRSAVRAKMAPLERTRRSYLRDTWETPAFRVTVSYGDDADRIDFVVCLLREETPPLDVNQVRLPGTAALLLLLGAGIESAGMQQAFDALGLKSVRPATSAQQVVDLRRQSGVKFHFHRSVNVGPELLLRQIEYLRAGELESRGWQGALPFGISFDDSPETVFAKIGTSPQRRDDQDFTGEGYWEFPDYSLLVTYSTMENFVLRVSICAPEARA